MKRNIECWWNTKVLCDTIDNPPKSLKIKYNNSTHLHKIHEHSHIKFYDMDSIDCGLAIDPNSLVLNLADNTFPGGCVATGSEAQEESLFRRTNYYKTLTTDLYPIKSDEAIYSPDVTILKNSKLTLYTTGKLLKMAFVACPGIKCPDTVIVNQDKQLRKRDVEKLKNKIRLIIQIAAKYRHDTIIFGALGCGAWKNPTKHVAQIFKEVLKECDGVVLNYCFAIMNTNDDNYKYSNMNIQSNLDVFKEVFSGK